MRGGPIFDLNASLYLAFALKMPQSGRTSSGMINLRVFGKRKHFVLGKRERERERDCYSFEICNFKRSFSAAQSSVQTSTLQWTPKGFLIFAACFTSNPHSHLPSIPLFNGLLRTVESATLYIYTYRGGRGGALPKRNRNAVNMCSLRLVWSFFNFNSFFFQTIEKHEFL